MTTITQSENTLRPTVSRRQTVFLAVATIAVVGLAYGPMMWTFFAQQWSKPHYQYFPFVLGAFVWLLWRNGRLAQPLSPKHPRLIYFNLIMLGAIAWTFLAVAYLAYSPWLAVISAILLVASCFLRVSSHWRVGYLWGIWAMLWLLVPPPLNRDQQLIGWLQHLSSRVSSILLDWLGVEHLMEGNTLLLPNKQFFVDEACSGIVSVLSIIACAVIYGIWRNRPPVHVILLAVAGIGWATIMNVLRITVIAVVFDWQQVDWSSGTSHEILGLVIFTGIFLALVSTDYLLLALLAPITTRDGESLGEPIKYGAKLAAVWDVVQQWGAPQQNATVSKSTTRRSWDLVSRFALGVTAILAFGTLAAAQLVVPYLFAPAVTLTARGLERGLTMESALLPSRIEGMKRTDFKRQERETNNVFGQYSRIYEYQGAKGDRYLVSCDFPFSTDWHDLTVCYAGIGWNLNGEPQIRSTAGVDQGSWDYIEASFTKPDGSAALLVYSDFDEYGHIVAPPKNSLFYYAWLTLERRYRPTRAERLFQIQVWTTGAGEVREEQAIAARKLLLHAREQFRRFIVQSEVLKEPPRP